MEIELFFGARQSMKLTTELEILKKEGQYFTWWEGDKDSNVSYFFAEITLNPSHNDSLEDDACVIIPRVFFPPVGKGDFMGKAAIIKKPKIFSSSSHVEEKMLRKWNDLDLIDNL